MQVDKSKCIGCGCCMGGCPVGAISFIDGKAEIDQTKCMHCGTCKMLCMQGAISE